MFTTSVKVSLASNLLALAAVGLALAGIPAAPPPVPYAVAKFLHVLGVILFFGNMIVGPLWLVFAWYRDDARMLEFAASTLDAADVYLTAPGVQLVVWNGLLLAPTFGGVRAQGWLLQSVLALVVTSLLAMGVALPLQARFVRAARSLDRAATRRWLIAWSVGGSVAMLPPTLIAWMMISKQPLWA